MLGLGRTRTDRVKDALKEAIAYTDELIRDERLRSDVRSAVGHGAVAANRLQEVSGFSGLTTRLAADRKLRQSLRSLLDDLDHAGGRVRRKRHRLRNALIVVGAGGAIATAVPNTRRWAAERFTFATNGGDPPRETSTV